MHHAAGERSGFVDDDGVAAPRQVPGRGEAARAGADDEHALARGRLVGRDRPAFLEGHVAQEAFDGVNAHRFVELAAVAGVLAGVVAHTAVDRGKGVVPDDDLPRVSIPAGLSLGQPRLDVLSGRAGVVAGRKAVDVERAHRAGWRHTGSCPPASGATSGPARIRSTSVRSLHESVDCTEPPGLARVRILSRRSRIPPRLSDRRPLVRGLVLSLECPDQWRRHRRHV